MIPKYTREEEQQLSDLAEQYTDILLEKRMELDSIEESDDNDSERFKTVFQEYMDIQNTLLAARRKLLDQFEDARFSVIKDSPEKILGDAHTQATSLINNRYRSYRQLIMSQTDADDREVQGFSGRDLRVDGLHIWLDVDVTTQDIKRTLRRHYEAFKDDPDRLHELDSMIEKIVSQSEHTSSTKGVLGKRFEFSNIDNLEKIFVTYPLELISLHDKVSSEVFKGGFDLDATPVRVIDAEKNRDAVFTLVSIDYSGLDETKISGQSELTEYDKVVLNAIISLYESGFRFVTTNMIYQFTVRNTGAHCSKKQAKEINESVTRLMFTRIIIDASEEAKIDHRIKDPTLDSTVINAKRGTGIINGILVDGIKLLDTSILFDYASQKDQVTRSSVKLLDTSKRKDTRTVILEEILRNRINAMKSPTKKMSNVIRYDSIYEQLRLTAASDGALRKQQFKIRKKIKTALDHYKDLGEIKSYKEKIEKKKAVSVEIRW